jgi:2-octaprenylphenol hydroxylase
LLERAAPSEDTPTAQPDDPDSWPIRHVALGSDSLALLAELGVEDFPRGDFHEIAVWEALGTATLRFTAAEAGLEQLGAMAELPALTSALWQRVGATPGIGVLLGAALQAISPRDRSVDLAFADGTVVPLDFLIGADGARSRVRELLGVAAPAAATGHAALATVVRTERSHDGVARQRFLKSGPLALLPTRWSHIVSVVWSQTPEQAAASRELDGAAFCCELTAVSGGVLGRVEAVGQRGTFPIAQQLTETFLPAPRVALIGDAARVVHPLAGLGVNLGLDDVQTLLAVFDAGGATGAGTLALRRWARRRRARSQIVQRVLMTLQQVYAQTEPLPVWLRNLGIRAVNGSHLLRQLFIHEALGADRSA